MERPLRFAVVGPVDGSLRDALLASAHRPTLVPCDGLVAGAAELAGDPPDLLVLAAPPGALLAETAGALRMWQALHPHSAVLLVGPLAREVELGAFAQRVAASFLAWPARPRELASAIDHALARSPRVRADAFLDLVHGIADEVNNPLQFAMGYLQLVQLSLDPVTGRDLLDQVEAAMEGARRVQHVVERLRAVETAATGPRRHEALDLRASLEAVVPADAKIPVVTEPPAGPFVVFGDPDALEPALRGLVEAATALAANDVDLFFVLTRLDQRVRLRLSLRGEPLTDWDLPRSFEPYALSRVLRGSAHGLVLFLAQTAAHAHGGTAAARRLPDGSIALDFEFPA